MNGKISERKMKRKWNKKSEKRCRITAKEESSISISLMMSHPQLRQIRELLDANDGVVQRWLERLGHGVGQDHSDHHRQDVWDLTGQLEHYDRCGYSVGDRSRQSSSTCEWRENLLYLSVSLKPFTWSKMAKMECLIHRKSLNLHVYTEYKAKSEFIQF